jgi:Domain of unknown function (DUF4331)
VSNHVSAANLRYPGDDARLDLADLFVFEAPVHADRMVLIIDANPFMTGSEFHPDTEYRSNIDNDGDLYDNASFTFMFTERKHGPQSATAYYATGPRARNREAGGEVLIATTPVGF